MDSPLMPKRLGKKPSFYLSEDKRQTYVPGSRQTMTPFENIKGGIFTLSFKMQIKLGNVSLKLKKKSTLFQI